MENKYVPLYQKDHYKKIDKQNLQILQDELTTELYKIDYTILFKMLF